MDFSTYQFSVKGMIGKTISHYNILEKLGEGGMRVVYLAEDTELDRKVALKFLPQQLSTDKELQARFKHKAKAAAALNHPNIVTVYEVGELRTILSAGFFMLSL